MLEYKGHRTTEGSQKEEKRDVGELSDIDLLESIEKTMSDFAKELEQPSFPTDGASVAEIDAVSLWWHSPGIVIF